MQTKRIYEPGIIKDDLIFFISFLLNIKSFNKNAIDIKQLSFGNEKYPFAIIWAIEWLYCEGAVAGRDLDQKASARTSKLIIQEKREPNEVTPFHFILQLNFLANQTESIKDKEPTSYRTAPTPISHSEFTLPSRGGTALIATNNSDTLTASMSQFKHWLRSHFDVGVLRI